jgi:copper(I)-binding protein
LPRKPGPLWTLVGTQVGQPRVDGPASYLRGHMQARCRPRFMAPLGMRTTHRRYALAVPNVIAPSSSEGGPQVIAGRRRLDIIGIALLLGMLGGCAAGQTTQTASQGAAVNGANGQAGPIAVRDAMFVYPPDGEHYYPAGSAVVLTLTIANSGSTEERLVKVESPAGPVEVNGSTTIPGRSAVHAIATEVTEVTETSTSAPTSTGPTVPTMPATMTTQPPTSGPATTSGPAVTTSGGPASTTTSELEPGELTIVLKTTEDIRPGRTVRVVLLFEHAGEIELQVPIAAPDEPRGESEH